MPGVIDADTCALFVIDAKTEQLRLLFLFGGDL